MRPWRRPGGEAVSFRWLYASRRSWNRISSWVLQEAGVDLKELVSGLLFVRLFRSVRPGD